MRRISINCYQCDKVFQIPPSRLGKKKYCSKDCYSKSMVGRKLSPEVKEVALKTIRSYDGKRDMPKGKRHRMWKGKDVGYRGLHYWVNRQLGKPKSCDFCGSKRSLEWANKSHEYKRELDDFMPLCKSCHKKYDLRHKESLCAGNV